jgi:ribosomal protein S18 acetylase RimI-like enzyme
VDDAALAAIQQRAQIGFYRAFAEHAPRGAVLEPAPGIVAVRLPERPERSAFNAVVAGDERSLLTTRDELADWYDDGGVRAWTVWTRPGDRAAAAALAAAGHVHDAQPMLMAAPLDELDLASRGPLELDDTGDVATALELNDRAYGYAPGQGFGGALASFPEGWRPYVAQADGVPAAALVVVPEHGNCEIVLVATVPEARGRGLAGELMRLALREARADGCTTTTLEASAMGEPVYARMGYRSLGRLGMWELRRPDPAL